MTSPEFRSAEEVGAALACVISWAAEHKPWVEPWWSRRYRTILVPWEDVDCLAPEMRHWGGMAQAGPPRPHLWKAAGQITVKSAYGAELIAKDAGMCVAFPKAAWHLLLGGQKRADK